MPCACFFLIIVVHLVEWFGARLKSTGPQGFFKRVRAGWVEDNFMKGQAAVNTTRDYIRVTVFFASTAVLLATFSAGTVATLDFDNSQKDLLHAKLGIFSGLMLLIFLIFLQATRIAIHFSFLINVSRFGGVPTSHQLMVKTFSHAHKFYSLGIRAYFLVIPVVSWIVSEWMLLALTPAYIYVIRQLESTHYIQKELARVEEEREALSTLKRGEGLVPASENSGTLPA